MHQADEGDEEGKTLRRQEGHGPQRLPPRRSSRDLGEGDPLGELPTNNDPSPMSCFFGRLLSDDLEKVYWLLEAKASKGLKKNCQPGLLLHGL